MYRISGLMRLASIWLVVTGVQLGLFLATKSISIVSIATVTTLIFVIIAILQDRDLKRINNRRN